MVCTSLASCWSISLILLRDLNHSRIAWLERLQFLLILKDECIALTTQAVDDGVGQQLWQD